MILFTFIAAISNEITAITFLQFGVINFGDAAAAGSTSTTLFGRLQIIFAHDIVVHAIPSIALLP